MRTSHLWLLLASRIAAAESSAHDGELVYGAGVAFMVHAPDGWVFDGKSGRAQGLDAVFYPKGSSFEDSRAVAFARAVPKGKQTARELMDQGFAAMRKQAPRLEVDRSQALTCGKKEAQLVTVAHDPAGNVEALVFLDEPGAVIVLGLMADDAARRTASMPRLRELCASYRFVGTVKH